MSTDWTTLKQRTAIWSRDTDEAAERSIGALYAPWSTLRSQTVQPDMAAGVSAWLDTLRCDTAVQQPQVVTLVARRIDVSGTGGALQIEGANPQVLQLVIGEVVGGDDPQRLTVAAPGGRTTVALDIGQPTLIQITLEGGVPKQTTAEAGTTTNLLTRSWALASQQASFAAAAALAEGDATSRETARSMLRWIVACIATATAAGQVAAPFVALAADAAAALEGLMGLDGGTRAVPVASLQAQHAALDELIGALEDYEQQKQALAGEQHQTRNWSALVGAIQRTATAEAAPIEARLAAARKTVGGAAASLRRLATSMETRQISASSDFVALKNAISSAEINQALESWGDGLLSATSGTFSALGGEYLSALSSGIQAVSKAKAGVEALLAGTVSDDLGRAAQAVLQNQRAMLAVALSHAADAAAPTAPIETDLAWNEYLDRVLAVLDTAKSKWKDATEAIDTWRADVQDMVATGRAFDAIFSVWLAASARVVGLKAQVGAAENVEAVWQGLVEGATGDAAKLAAMQTLLDSRIGALRRSIFIAGLGFADAWRYVRLSDPPSRVGFDAAPAALRTAMAAFDGVVSGSGAVRLPGTLKGVTVTVRPTVQGRTLSWSIVEGNPDLAGHIGDPRQTALWVTQARCTLAGDGFAPGGDVKGALATSGVYTVCGRTYVSRGFSGRFDYTPGQGAYTQVWAVDGGAYLQPSVYTQWSMTLDDAVGPLPKSPTVTMTLDLAVRQPPG